jgi:hypothetical protein
MTNATGITNTKVVLELVFDAGQALPLTEIISRLEVENKMEQVNAWIASRLLQRVPVSDVELYIIKTKTPVVAVKMKSPPVTKPFKSPLMSLVQTTESTPQPGQGLSKLKHTLQQQRDELTDQLRKSSVLLKNPFADLELITAKWKTGMYILVFQTDSLEKVANLC